MKRIFTLILISLILSGCQFIDYFQEETLPDNTTSTTFVNELETPTTSETNNQSQTVNEKGKDESIKSLHHPTSFLGEEIISSSNFPKLTFPKTVPEDINEAIEQYYLTHFSSQEQAANQTKLTETDLDLIRSQINTENDLSALEISIAQIRLTLNQTAVYVPRIIVPISYSKAEKIATDNDTRLLNHALTAMGNRLVVLAYYNETTNSLIPMHLVNSTHSLFFSQP